MMTYPSRLEAREHRIDVLRTAAVSIEADLARGNLDGNRFYGAIIKWLHREARNAERYEGEPGAYFYEPDPLAMLAATAWLGKPLPTRDEEHLWSARNWSPMLSIAEHLGDRESVRVLVEHGIHADHCDGYDVHAWPCPTAADTLNFLIEVTP